MSPATSPSVAAVDAVARLDNSYLVIQGPPGTGKTFTMSHAILALLKAGKRIAVSSNSHKVINHALAAVEARAVESGFGIRGAKRGSESHRQHAAAAVLQDGPVPARITPSLPIAIALIRP